MKKSLSMGLLFASAIAFGQTITNPGFESYNTLPVCPTASATNTSITHCQTWNGLSSSYGSSCTYSDFSGSASGVQYFNTAGTTTCNPVSPHSGTAYAFMRGWGFYPSTTGHSEYLYETVNSLTGGTSYLVSGYMHTQGTWLGLSAWLVPTSVGTGASAILNNLRSQSIPIAYTTTVSTAWVAVSMKVTPPSTGNYYLVLGDNNACKDGAASNVGTMAVDDFTISVAPTCTTNAGSTKTNTTNCCPPGPCTNTVIGTAGISGQYYSWAGPANTITCSTCAQPTVNPCGPTSIYTVTVTGDLCATATATVQVNTVTYSGPSCCRIGHYSGKSITEFSAYPNPAKDKFTVTLYAIPEYVRVIDVSGKLMYESKDVPESELQIDVSKYPKGVYYVTAKIGDKIEKQAVVVE